VRPPQRIILDMDDIDDPSRNSPCCAVTATTAPSPRAGVAGSHVPRLQGHRRALHHHQPSKGAARRSTRRVLAVRPDRRHGVPGRGPRLLAVAGKPASCT
jgi:hypothetical protein